MSNTDIIFVPLGAKPDEKTQALLDSGEFIFSIATTGGINPNAKGPKAGAYYKRKPNNDPQS